MKKFWRENIAKHHNCVEVVSLEFFFSMVSLWEFAHRAADRDKSYNDLIQHNKSTMYIA